jgi:hypothetical protein
MKIPRTEVFLLYTTRDDIIWYMIERLTPSPVETGTVQHSGGPYEATEDDRLLCARTNMLLMVRGDDLSKQLIGELIETVNEDAACLTCPVTACSVKYELNSQDGSDKRSNDDCAVFMSDVLKPTRGMTLAEFVQTPQGKK